MITRISGNCLSNLPKKVELNSRTSEKKETPLDEKTKLEIQISKIEDAKLSNEDKYLNMFADTIKTELVFNLRSGIYTFDDYYKVRALLTSSNIDDNLFKYMGTDILRLIDMNKNQAIEFVKSLVESYSTTILKNRDLDSNPIEIVDGIKIMKDIYGYYLASARILVEQIGMNDGIIDDVSIYEELADNEEIKESLNKFFECKFGKISAVIPTSCQNMKSKFIENAISTMFHKFNLTQLNIQKRANLPMKSYVNERIEFNRKMEARRPYHI